jgi:pimeloyl-ACP methyl ester carboxylesterase
MWLDYRGLSRTDIQRIESPVLVLAGDRDDMAPVDEAAVLYRTLAQGELAICPEADHFAVLHRAPMLASVIRDFVARHQP